MVKLDNESNELLKRCMAAIKYQMPGYDLEEVIPDNIEEKDKDAWMARTAIKMGHDRRELKVISTPKDHEIMRNAFEQLGYSPDGKYTIKEWEELKAKEKAAKERAVREAKADRIKRLNDMKKAIELELVNLNKSDDQIKKEIDEFKANSLKEISVDIKKFREEKIAETNMKFDNKIRELEEKFQAEVNDTYNLSFEGLTDEDINRSFSVEDLKDLCRAKGIEFKSKAKKDDLIALIRAEG